MVPTTLGEQLLRMLRVKLQEDSITIDEIVELASNQRWISKIALLMKQKIPANTLLDYNGLAFIGKMINISEKLHNLAE